MDLKNELGSAKKPGLFNMIVYSCCTVWNDGFCTPMGL